MGFPVELALRYMRSRKRAFVSVGTMFAIIGVSLGVAALATVMSVTGGFRAEFRDKVLGVNAHVLVLKYSSDFREYRKIMDEMRKVPGVIGIAPFVINPMMVTHGARTATGVLLKGVDPKLMPGVLDLPKHIVAGSLEGLRLPDAKPPARRRDSFLDDGTALGAEPAAPKDRKPLLKALKDELDDEEDPGAAAPPNGGDSADAPQGASPEDAPSDALPPDAPRGNVVPEGGYQSALPGDDEELPEEVDPDPCRSPEAVKKLPGIIIGATLARNLAAGLGDCVQVTSPTIGYTYSRGSIRAPVAKQFRVIAIFDAGFDQYDSKLVYTDLYEAQAFYDAGDSVTGVEMKVSNIDGAKGIARDIDRRLSNGIYHTMDWEELNHGLFTALRIQQIMMSLVLALIIIVAAFTVIATLIMVVLDKKREIAVLKAMGATDTAILRSFLYQGAIIGVIGAFFGLALGIGVCKGLLVYAFPLDPKVYFISHLPVQVNYFDFAMVGVFAIVVCLIATVWPAMYAARLRPAEAFRSQQ
ncbi:MAG: FtsX-like permease family protein [Sorangiineae bacterium]|nr:FtsX-like permease family protein [Polyangiaceae bacterium]MEB2324225.1 FtsX-like permease family protein [Sorangiineae bacterium]